MLVLDNLIFRWQTGGGISSVWYELSKRIIEQCHDYMFYEYSNSNKNHLRKKLSIPSSHIKTLSDSFFFLKKYLPVSCHIDDTFIFHSSYYRTCSDKKAINVITLHDFTYEYFRFGLTKFIHCKTKYKALRNADYIVCISNNTKTDLAKFVPDINLDKVSIIYNGVSEEYFPLDVKKQNLLLFVGARDEYKNFDLAVISASKANMPLFICGKKLTKEEKELLDKFLPSKYRFLGFISNEELNTYYNKAYALLYPSSYEGFGIPVIEAQKAGCPVIAMNSSSIPEIIGNDELLINDATPDAIIEKINILKDSEEREKIVKLGIENAKNYSWNKTFQNYQKLYQYIIKENFGKFQ